ncbi:hypothetical protein LR48_Vigan02g262400 [Vigna angularis]|uniref:Glucose-6-phosphate dehydrogenase C-terminal domain-containing protein n=1 Tax=Phaseolus angularis TaxID=3914 RepID=A0A0L9U253_PHAAN|nr:hypothetical protein LR48_Vigan02g262400 [Vigna angularis]
MGFRVAVRFGDSGTRALLSRGRGVVVRCGRIDCLQVLGSWWCENTHGGCLNVCWLDLDRATNELVIRVQLDEAIYLKINNKVPVQGMKLDRSNLNLHYASRYSKEIPDAYERLLLDAIEGERRLFIRSGKSDAAKTSHVNVPAHKRFNLVKSI